MPNRRSVWVEPGFRLLMTRLVIDTTSSSPNGQNYDEWKSGECHSRI